MDLKVTRYEIDDRVATLVLNRPDRLNSWTGRMHAEYRWILDQADRDPEVRVIVVTGAGRGFCAGADTAALKLHAERGAYDPGRPKTSRGRATACVRSSTRTSPFNSGSRSPS